MSWLDTFFTGYTTVLINGVPLPAEQAINFLSGVSGLDSPSAGTTNLTVTASTTLSTPQRLTYANSGSSISIAVAGAEQLVLINASGGAGTYLMPTGCVDGQLVRVSDTNPATWGSTPPLLSVGSTVSIENPRSLGTFVTAGTVTMPAIAGDDVVYVWLNTENTWKIQ